MIHCASFIYAYDCVLGQGLYLIQGLSSFLFLCVYESQSIKSAKINFSHQEAVAHFCQGWEKSPQEE